MRSLKKYFKKPPRQTIIIYSISIAILLACFFVVYLLFGKSFTSFVTDTKSFKAWLDTYNGLSAVIFVFIRTFQTVIKIIPAEPLEIAAGYAFGTWGGLALCSLGTLIGSLIIVVFAKCFGNKFVSAFINEDALNDLSIIRNKKNQRLFLFAFYIIPATPKDMLTYAACSLNINLTEFFIITTIARIPSIITSTICGSQIEQNNLLAAGLVFAATALVSLVCALAYKKKKSTNDTHSVRIDENEMII